MNLICAFLFAGLLGTAACSRIPGENNLWDEHEDFAIMRSEEGVPEPEFYDSSAGPEKLSIEIVRLEKNRMEEGEKPKEQEQEKEEEEGKMKKAIESEVDEETIRKAEKIADKDLLNGLNRILKNNETLKDVFKAENVYPIS